MTGIANPSYSSGLNYKFSPSVGEGFAIPLFISESIYRVES